MHVRGCTTALGLLLIAVIGPGRVAGAEADRDGDGIPDAVEVRLGTAPSRTEQLKIMWADRSPARTDIVDIRSVAFCWVAKGRSLWRIDLASEWPVATHVTNLYFDLDLDRATGRKRSGPNNGTDLMLGIQKLQGGASRYTADGKPVGSPAHKPRCWASGRSLHVCLDVPLLQRQGRSVCRLRVLVQRMKPTRQKDTVGPILLDLPAPPVNTPLALPPAPKPRVRPTAGVEQKAVNPSEINGSFEQNIKGWVSGGAKIERTTNMARVGTASMKISGPSGERDYFVCCGPVCLEPSTYYRFSAWLRIDRYPAALEPMFIIGPWAWHTATYDVRKVGQWQPFRFELLTGSGAPEEHKIRLFKGVSAKESKNVDALVFTDGIKLEKLEHEPPRISHFEATPHWREDGTLDARLTWVTHRPYGAEVEYGAEGRPRGKLVELKGSQRNHRIVIPDVPPGVELTYRLTLIGLGGERYAQPAGTVRFDRLERAGKARHCRVKLDVAETAQVDRHNWPATFGVPLPQGDLADPTRTRMLAPAGRPVRLQTRVLSRWSDGSIRWLLVDCPIDVSAGKTVSYTLEYGTDVEPPARAAPTTQEVRRQTSEVSAATETRNPKHKPPGNARKSIRAQRGFRTNSPKSESPLAVTVKDEEVTVTTGPLRFSVSAGPIRPFREVRVDCNRDGRFEADETVLRGDKSGGFLLTGTDGKTYRASTTGPWVVEERGPQKVVLRADGRHTADTDAIFPMTVRVVAYAGQPMVRVLHTFVNDQGDGGTATFRTLVWRLPLEVDGFTLGAADPITGTLERGPICLRQLLDDGFAVTGAGAKPIVGRRAPGWATVSGRAGAVTVAMQDFWQLYPKGISLAADRLDLELCPPLNAAHYADRKTDWHKLYFYCREGFYRLRTGIAKRHEWLVRLDAKPPAADTCQKLARALAHPLDGTNPQWFCASKAMLTELTPQRADQFAVYEEVVDRKVDAVLRNREQGHEYGMLNYGDWYGERQYNWGNLEYDLAYVCLAQYVRTGNPRYLRVGLPSAWHTMDVDLVHHWPSPETIGKVWIHCLCHTGYQPEYGFKKPGGLPGGFTPSHTWTEGMVEAYWLTGDRRLLAASKMVADAYGSYKLRDWRWPGTRSIGWMMTFFAAVYQATLDPYYLNAMRLVFDMAWSHRGDGAFQETLHRGHCNCKDARHHGGVGFMDAVLLSGLTRYHRISGDPRAAEAIVAVARDMNRTIWNAKREGYRYSACPRSPAGSGTMGLAAEGQLYAYDLTGDREILDVVMRGMKRLANGLAGSRGGSGKGSAFVLRNMPPALAWLAARGITTLADAVRFHPVSMIRAEADGEFSVRMQVHNLGSKPTRCRLEAIAVPDGWTLEDLPRTFEVAARSEAWAALVGRAKPRDDVIADAIRLRFTPANQPSQTFVVPVVAARLRPLPMPVAVAGEDTEAGRALEVMGVAFKPVGRLSDESLGEYGAILAGWEPFRYNRGGLVDAWPKVAKFVRAGGILVLFQADDKSWPNAPELAGVVLQEPRDTTARIVAGDDELFRRPHRVTNLSEVLLYDTIERVAPPWQVLVTDTEGRPAVVGRVLGSGHILLVQPSYERIVAGTMPAGEGDWRQCWMFLDNVLSWIGRSARARPKP